MLPAADAVPMRPRVAGPSDPPAEGCLVKLIERADRYAGPLYAGVMKAACVAVVLAYLGGLR